MKLNLVAMLPPVTHVLLDAARMGEHMDVAKELNPDHDSLYRGGKEQSLSTVAPYLFQFSSPTPFSDWFLYNGWGNSWGVLIESQMPLAEMHKYLRNFLLVNTEEGKQLYFRFYDPRVLRIFLPTCDTQQLMQFFGPVQQFICEDEDPAYALNFSFDGKKLITERVEASSIFPALKKDTQPPVLSTTITGDTTDVITIELNSHKPARRFLD